MNLYGDSIRRKMSGISALYLYFSEKNESVLSPCSCSVPCTKVRFEPTLSYALLSRKNIERLVINSYEKERQLQVQPSFFFKMNFFFRPIG